jgi:hypothetical protein
MSAPTLVGPTSTQQINTALYVGEGYLDSIQDAVDFAAASGGGYFVIIPSGYAGSDTIASIVGGTTSITIADRRIAQAQNYSWNGSAYVPSGLHEMGGLQVDQNTTTHLLMATGSSAPAIPSLAYFGHAASYNQARVMATGPNTTTVGGVRLDGESSDYSISVNYLDCNLNLITVNQPTTFAEAITAPAATITNLAATSANLGSLVVPGTAMIYGDMTLYAPLTATTITANDAALATCEVDNSPVRTFANTPDGPGQGMIWPDIGVPVSLGSTWQSPSIDPATLARTNVNNNFAATQSFTSNTLGSVPTPSQGLTLAWNVSNATGESDFINSPAGAGGGFAWYNVASASTITPTTPRAMYLDSATNLHVPGGIRAYGQMNSLNSGVSQVSIGTYAGGLPAIAIENQTAPADTKIWDFTTDSGGGFQGRAINDAYTVANNWLAISRVGATVGTISFNAPVSTNAGLTVNFPGTGTTSPFLSEQPNLAVGSLTSLFVGISNTVDNMVYYGFQNGGSAAANRGVIGWAGGNNVGQFDINGNWLFLGQISGPSSRSTGQMPFPVAQTPQVATGLLGTNFPTISMVDGVAVTDGRIWDITTDTSSNLLFRAVNDAYTIAGIWMQVTRSGSTPTGVTFNQPIVINEPTQTGTTTPVFALQPNLATNNFVTYFVGQANTPGHVIQLGFQSLGSGVNGHGIIGMPGGPNATFDLGGNWVLAGTITATAKNFRIVHPLDDTKNLIHGCPEGPEYAVYYRGEGQTDATAMATITLPDYFEALTRPEGRTVLLTEIFEDDDTELGKLAASRVKDGTFRVRSEFALQKFYWEVKAVRTDVEPLAIETEREAEHEGGTIGA